MSFISKLFGPKPFNQGYLPELDGHKVFFMEFGNPEGKPVLFFHGGPGGCCKAGYVKDFDLKKYRLIMFDQRGCGRSTPLGEMKHNSTQDTLKDAMRLLNDLKISEKVIIRGASWGSALALLFAIEHPEKISKLLLTQVFLADEANWKWISYDSAMFYPDILEQIRVEASGNNSEIEYFAQLINSDKPEEQRKALDFYASYEWNLGSLDPQFGLIPFNEQSIMSARISINYTAQKFMLENGEIMNNIHKISDIPTLIVHNRLDFLCPVQAAYELHKALHQSKLVIVPERGHFGKLLSKVKKREIKEFLQ